MGLKVLEYQNRKKQMAVTQKHLREAYLVNKYGKRWLANFRNLRYRKRVFFEKENTRTRANLNFSPARAPQKQRQKSQAQGEAPERADSAAARQQSKFQFHKQQLPSASEIGSESDPKGSDTGAR